MSESIIFFFEGIEFEIRKINECDVDKINLLFSKNGLPPSVPPQDIVFHLKKKIENTLIGVMRVSPFNGAFADVGNLLILKDSRGKGLSQPFLFYTLSGFFSELECYSLPLRNKAPVYQNAGFKVILRSEIPKKLQTILLQREKTHGKLFACMRFEPPAGLFNQ